MRKLLNLLGAVGLVATTSATVIACGQDLEKPEVTIEKVIEDFKEDVNQIVQEHIAEISKNFFLVDQENSLSFFNKEKFSSYMGSNSEKNADDSIRESIIKDFNNIIELNLLKYKIELLQKKEKYSTILDNINVFNGVTLSSNEKINLATKISTVTQDKIWFGTTKFSYSVSVNFKNKKGVIEEYKISDIDALISLTDNQQIGGEIQKMYSSISENFIKNEISKIYTENLILKNKTYLENVDEEILDYLNSNNYILNFINFVKSDFGVELKMSSNVAIKELVTTASYRSSTVKFDDQSELDFQKSFKDFLFEDGKKIEQFISSTQENFEKEMNSKIEENLNKINKNLWNDPSLEKSINSVFKMRMVKVKSMTYKIEENNYIDIPDIYLNLWQVKDKKVSRREEINQDIIKNIKSARESFIKTYGIEDKKIPNLDTYFFNYKGDSKIINKWINELNIVNKAEISEYVNLTHKELINDRNKFLKESKQDNFQFDIWTHLDGGLLYKPLIKINNKKMDLGTHNSSISSFYYNVIFELDYFKISLETFKTTNNITLFVEA
ncbi:lipoprotein [Spiroplasma cantharicola]|uniref:Lipoprotein n=1 Tax=Spiroplasma cantharicola TaxID=362837 RepID=A0A0M4KC98_9MOLU|nr:lipoprotein [Spiroplasma cantharicola]ALD66290.1 hypothetical protein SCANT_v1c03800 [Spiroplasma cantharicola]